MTCREKMIREHPNLVGSEYSGGCVGCPFEYGYLPKPEPKSLYCEKYSCTACWDQEISGTEKGTKSTIPWSEIRAIVDDAVKKRDRTVSLYFNPDTGMSVNVYPWPSPEDLFEMYQKCQITFDDFRAKSGLSLMREETFIQLLSKKG